MIKTEGIKKTVSSCVSFKPETLKRADKIVEKNLLPGVSSRSGLIEYALAKVFKEIPESEGAS
jgi:hypothetical protein